jgi:hypothetical protein
MLGKLFPCPWKQALFALLSGADLALTCWLLERSGGLVYEANPLASWWLARAGWAGLVCFKAAVVFLVLGLTAVIFRQRPRAADRLLGFGCAGLALVVLYSSALCRSPYAATPQEFNDWLDRSVNRAARREYGKHEALRYLLKRGGQDLVARRCSLREAQERVAASERGSDLRWLRGLAASYPGRPPQEVIAACLILRAVDSLEGEPRKARQVALRLEREFELTYGNSLPPFHRKFLGRFAPEDAGRADRASGRAPGEDARPSARRGRPRAFTRPPLPSSFISVF